MAAGNSMAAAARALWQRAPAWRFVLMSGALATLVFSLFPPLWPQREPSETVIPPATYIPQPRRTAAIEPTQAPAAPRNPHNSIGHLAASSQQALTNPSPTPTAAGAPKTASLALAVTGSGAAADNGTGLPEAITGKLYSGSIRAAGFDVPLPEGQWAILAKGAINSKEKATFVGVMYFLGQIKRHQLAATATIYAVSDKTSHGITASDPLKIEPGCKATNRTYMFKPEQYDDSFPQCWELHTHFTADMRRWADRAVRMSNLERAAAGDLAGQGIDIPQEFITAAYILIQNSGLLYADYEFSPEFEGIKSTDAPSFADSDWYPSNLSRFPDKLAYQERIMRWGTAFWPKIQAAFMKEMP